MELRSAQPREVRGASRRSTRGGEIDEADLAHLRDHGFGHEAIWDIGAITSFFAMSNRLVHLAGTPPNEPFYLMGRVPK